MIDNHQSSYFAGNNLASGEGERITANYPELRTHTDIDSIREFTDAIDEAKMPIGQFILMVLKEGDSAKFYKLAKIIKAASNERR